MAIAYYPGCTLKTKARNLESAALSSARALGIDLRELPRWNCCGAVASLADDNLLLQVAPVRDLVRVAEAGCDTVVTLCSMCYNTLARANRLMREDAEKRAAINRFMDEEPDYAGEVEVLHYLQLLERELGWEGLRSRVQRPLAGLKVAPYYGCTLTRPHEISIDERPLAPAIMHRFLRALGADPVSYVHDSTCCGSYQVLAQPDAALSVAQGVLAAARSQGAQALALSCPLCEYNMGARQRELLAGDPGWAELPTLYFTQLLAVALGLDHQAVGSEINQPAARQLLQRAGA